MSKVFVYRFKMHNINTSDSIVQPQYATKDKITELGGTIIEDSKIEIIFSDIDGNGFYFP